MIVKIIKYFFDNLKKILTKNINISEMNLNNLKKTLNELEKNGIMVFMNII